MFFSESLWKSRSERIKIIRLVSIYFSSKLLIIFQKAYFIIIYQCTSGLRFSRSCSHLRREVHNFMLHCSKCMASTDYRIPFYETHPVKSHIIYINFISNFVWEKKFLRVPWWHSGYDSRLLLPWPKFKPWLGNSDPASRVAWPKKVICINGGLFINWASRVTQW